MVTAEPTHTHNETADLRPRPDPTLLTTQQIVREITGLKELIETRLDAMDKAISLLQAYTDKQPTTTTVAQMVASLSSLVDEKFSSVQKQFTERDVRTEQTSKDSNVAIDAALQAQKEAVSKSEVGFTKQIDGIITLVQTSVRALDDKISDLKERTTSTEAQKKGSSEGIGMVGALVLGAVAIISVGISLVALVTTMNAP